MHPPREAFILCADDFAMSASIDDAILSLSERGRLSAVSCMAAFPGWQSAARRIAPFRDRIDIGVHLTLADAVPMSSRLAKQFPRLPRFSAMMAMAISGRIDRAAWTEEIALQVTAFSENLGAAPDHIDGHLHSHIVPVIRELVSETAARLAPNAWIRDPGDRVGRIFARGVGIHKALVLSSLSALARPSGTAVNDGFGGAYGLRGNEDYAALFERFIEARGRRHLVMCHPGRCAEADDSIGAARVNEYAFFSGARFEAVLHGAGVRVARFKEVADPRVSGA